MLYVFSENILLFLKRIRSEANLIISREVGLPLQKGGFVLKDILYKPSFVLFEHPKTAGFFNPLTLEIGLNKAFLLEPEQDLVKDVLRHEIAHLLTYIAYGCDAQDHGGLFHKTCRMYGWGDSVSSASMEPADKSTGESPEGDLRRVVFEKVKKLLALASSENPHEAEMAALKANQILLRHNLGIIKEIGMDVGPEVFMKRVLTAKRISQKLVAIADILRTFLVSPVFNRVAGTVYLELTGEKTNIEIGEYVGVFLDRRLEELWARVKKEGKCPAGPNKKNSFMRGVSCGYLAKAKNTVRQYSHEECRALCLVQETLDKRLGLVYPRLLPRRSKAFYCHETFNLGRVEGLKLDIKGLLPSGPSGKSLTEGNTGRTLIS